MARKRPMAQGGAVELPALLDLKAAAPLAESLLGRRGKPVTIDASKVEKLGGQCLQVLLSAAATWQADRIALDIVDPSEEFESGLKLLGVPTDAFTGKDLH